MRKFQIDNTWYNRSIVLKEDLIMAKQHDKQFKLDAIQYYEDHKDFGVHGCAKNLGIGYSILSRGVWEDENCQKGWMPGFHLRNVETFRCLMFRISCMDPPVTFWYRKTPWSCKRKNTGCLWWFQVELWCSENHCRTAQNWWSHFGKKSLVHIWAKWEYALTRAGWTITRKDSDFSTELQNILDEQFNPDLSNAVWCSDITYI